MPEQPDSSRTTEFYTSRAATFRETAARLRARSNVLTNARIATFAAFLVFGVLAERGAPAFWVPAGAAAISFMILVVKHRKTRRELRDVEARAALCDLAIARYTRKWSELPIVIPSMTEAHPYAHDLDLFGANSVTQLFGPVRTHHGRRTLKGWLVRPSPIPEVLERQEAVAVLRDDIDLRESLAVQGGTLDRHTEGRLNTFLTWVTTPPEMRVGTVLRWVERALPLATFTFVGLQLAGVVDKHWWIIPMNLSVMLALLTFRRVNAEFDRAFGTHPASLQYSGLFAVAEQAPPNTPLLKRIHEELSAGPGTASQSIEQLEKIMTWSDARHSPGIATIFLEGLFLWSYQALIALQRWQAERSAHVAGWFDALGELEALSSLATLAHDQPDWCFPVLDATATKIEATALGHPILADTIRVHNDVSVGPTGTLLLVTGSNMSGKSTLLRAIGVNSVLAQAGAPVCASAYGAPIVHLYTSINVHDSITAGVSLYMAQLQRLKEILDAARRATPHEPLCYLLDEILSGTNSADRTVAVRAILHQLLHSHAIGVVTTHDLAVAADERIQGVATNVHFEETVDPQQGTMTFDYRMRPGQVERSNALELMRMMGIETE